MSVSKKILDIDQNLPTKDGKGGFAFPFRSHPQTASTKRWSNAVRHFLQSVQKKAVKVAKVAVRHFLQAVQKKVAKVAKPALPLLPSFFRQVLKNVTTPPPKKNRLYRFYRLFFGKF